MDFDTQAHTLQAVEEPFSFDAKSPHSHPQEPDPHDISYWYPDLPDDLPVYDANIQLPVGSQFVTTPWDAYDDPQHPRNLSRFHPTFTEDENLLHQCLPINYGRFYALVDRDLYAELNQSAWRFHIHERKGSYRRYVRKGNGKRGTTYLHREVMRLHLLRCPEYRLAKCIELEVDPTMPLELLIPTLLKTGVVHHRNHNPEDNRLINLDLVAEIDNRRQTHAKPSPTGYRGVSVQGAQYLSRVQRRRPDGSVKTHSIGVFAHAEVAALARCLYILAHWDVWFVKRSRIFTPTAAEEQLWQSVVHLIRNGWAVHFNWHENALPETILVLLVKARKAVATGDIAKIEWRG